MPQDIILTIEDKSGDQATASVRVNEALIADIVTFTAAWATAVNNVIFGVIRSAIAHIVVQTNLLTGNTMVDTADVEHVGKFVFEAINGQRVLINIPTLNEAAVLAHASDNLDQAEPEVAAFIAAMVSGIAVTGGTIQPCDIGESSINEVIFAREAFKNSGARR